MRKRWKIGVIALLCASLSVPVIVSAVEKKISKEIFFQLDKDYLTRESMEVLSEVAKYLQENPKTTVNIIGHTCDIASDEYNLELGKRRAQAAANYLNAHYGISMDRISISSKGEKEPKYDNSNPSEKKKNRRDEIILTIPIPPPTVRISADPSEIMKGSNSVLSWSSTNADKVHITPQLGDVDLNGKKSVSPNKTTTYTATAIGEGGEATSKTTITVTEPPTEIIRSVYTSVVDKDGNFITDLPKDNFTVYEGGEEKEIVKVTYEIESYPSAVGLILDKSGSMQSAIDKLKDAAKTFISLKKPTDRILVIGFSSDVVTLSDFETDADKLYSAIDKLQAKGQTVLYDALYEGSKAMRLAAPPRMIILMTDGVDEGGALSKGSSHTLEEAIEAAQLNEVTVYTIGLGNKLDPEILKKISTQTNGVSYFATDPEQLKEIYSKISTGALKGKYKIDYKTKEDSKGKRTVKTKTGRIIGVH